MSVHMPPGTAIHHCGDSAIAHAVLPREGSHCLALRTSRSDVSDYRFGKDATRNPFPAQHSGGALPRPMPVALRAELGVQAGRMIVSARSALGVQARATLISACRPPLRMPVVIVGDCRRSNPQMAVPLVGDTVDLVVARVVVAPAGRPVTGMADDLAACRPSPRRHPPGERVSSKRAPSVGDLAISVRIMSAGRDHPAVGVDFGTRLQAINRGDSGLVGVLAGARARLAGPTRPTCERPTTVQACALNRRSARRAWGTIQARHRCTSGVVTSSAVSAARGHFAYSNYTPFLRVGAV
jgi:hypothetical protein